MAYTFKGKNGEMVVNNWEDALSHGQDGWSLKASAARRGVTMKGLEKVLGPLPKSYGTVGYNPNLNNTDPDLVKILKAEGTRGARKSNASTVTKTSAPAPTNALAPSSGKYSLSSTSDTTVADSAIAAKQKAYAQMLKSPPAGIPAAAWPEIVRKNLGLSTSQVKNVDNALAMAAKPGERMASDVVSDAVYSRDNAAAAFKQVQDIALLRQQASDARNKFEAEVGGDPRAMKAYDKEIASLAGWKNNTPGEIAGLARTAALRAQSMPSQLDGVNDFLTNNPVGQLFAPIAAAGIGITAGAAAGAGNVAPGVSVHSGSGMPATPSTPAPNYTDAINTAAADNPAVTPKWHNGTQQINPEYPFTPTEDIVGPTRPGDVQLDDIKAPIYPTPTGGPIPGVNGSGTPTAGGASGPSPSTGQTGPTPDGSPVAPGGTGTPSGNWLTDPNFLATLAGAGISLYTGEQQAEAARYAAKLQADGAQKAIDAQKAMYDQTRDDLEPWRTAGATALTDLQSFDDTPFQFNTTPGTEIDPSYSFRLKEGMKALENSAAARGNLLSGNTMKGITNYGQEAASQEYNNAFNRYQTQRGTKLNRLQSLAGVGQTAVQQSQQAGQNYANNASNMITGGANAQAQGITDSATASGMGWMGVTNSLVGGLNNYYQQQQNNDNRQMINALIGGR